MDTERRGGLPVPAARSGGASACGADRTERAARGRRLRRPVASGDRTVERGLARRTSPRAGRRGRQQDRPLDRALPARHRDMAGRDRSIRSSTPTPWTTSRKRSGWRRWMGVESASDAAQRRDALKPALATAALRPPAARSRHRSHRPSRHRSLPLSQVLVREVCWTRAVRSLRRRLEPAKRIRNAVALDAVEAARQHRGVLDRHRRALRHVGRHRMAGVAEQRHLALAQRSSALRSTIAHLCTSGHAASTCSTWRSKPANALRNSLTSPLADHDSIRNSGSGWLVTR